MVIKPLRVSVRANISIQGVLFFAAWSKCMHTYPSCVSTHLYCSPPPPIAMYKLSPRSHPHLCSPARINSQPARALERTAPWREVSRSLWQTDRQTAGSLESRGRWEGNYPWQTYLCRFHLLPASLQPALITVTTAPPPLKGFNWKIKVF